MKHGFQMQNLASQFSIDYRPIQRRDLNFRQSTEWVASKILEKWKRPKLFFSGGSDSEVMVRSFLAHTQDIDVIFVRFLKDLNAHEWEFAKLLAHRLGFSIQVLEFDILEFWSAECSVYAEKSKSFSPQLNAHLKMSELVGGVSIFGIGEPELMLIGNQINWIERERDYAWFRYFYDSGSIDQELLKNEFVAFFQLYPEVSFVFLRDFLEMNSQEKRQKISEAKFDFISYKKNYYLKFWPDLLIREKWTGFESLQNEDFLLRKELKVRHEKNDRILSLSANEMWRRMNRFSNSVENLTP